MLDLQVNNPFTDLRAFWRVWAMNFGGFLVAIASHVAVTTRHFGLRQVFFVSRVFLNED